MSLFKTQSFFRRKSTQVSFLHQPPSLMQILMQIPNLKTVSQNKASFQSYDQFSIFTSEMSLFKTQSFFQRKSTPVSFLHKPPSLMQFWTQSPNIKSVLLSDASFQSQSHFQVFEILTEKIDFKVSTSHWRYLTVSTFDELYLRFDGADLNAVCVVGKRKFSSTTLILVPFS